MHTFRILHLSDLHLSKRPNEVVFLHALLEGAPADCTTAWLSAHHLRRLLGLSFFVQYYARKLDAILVTGDLATSGKEADLSRALQFLDSSPIIDSSWFSPPSQNLSATLKREDVPIRLMPGNHDRYQTRFPFLPGNKTFDSVFKDYWKAGQGVQTQIILRGATNNDQLAVISADCTLASAFDATVPLGHLGQGKAYRALINRLKEETELIRQSPEPTAVIWALHFAPKPPRSKVLLRLINDDDLLLSADSNDVQCILCGHLHDTMQYRHKAHLNVWVGAAGTSCIAEDVPCEFSIYDIDVDNGGIIGNPRTEIYQWDGENFVQI